MNDEQPPQPDSHPQPKMELRPLLFVIAAVAVGVAIFFVYKHKTGVLHSLADREDWLRHVNAERPMEVAAIIFALYVATTALSIPLGIVFTVFAGWLFKDDPHGLVKAVLLADFGWTAGSTLAMLISRHLLRDAISHRFTAVLTKADELVERDGPLYVLSLRLVHIIPFWLINLVMGWTKISVWSFWWASQLGMLPASILYAYAGDKLPSIRTLATEGVSSILEPKIIIAFVVLALVPLGLKWILDRLRR